MGGEERRDGMITVYHGGTESINTPLVRIGRKDLDFGPGFYITDIRSQAEGWASRVGRQRRERPLINEYLFDIEIVKKEYRYLRFEHYDAEWLHFIVDCRSGYDSSVDYDCVEGGVANDRVVDTVEGFMNGTIDEAHALSELSKHQPNNQICILNQELVDICLKFVKVTKL